MSTTSFELFEEEEVDASQRTHERLAVHFEVEGIVLGNHTAVVGIIAVDEETGNEIFAEFEESALGIERDTDVDILTRDQRADNVGHLGGHDKMRIETGSLSSVHVAHKLVRVGADESDVLLMDIPIDTGHDRPHCVDAYREAGVVKPLLNHVGRYGEFHPFFRGLRQTRILIGRHSHKVEMSVKEPEVNLLGIIVDVESKRLVRNLLVISNRRLAGMAIAPSPSDP